MYRYRFPLDASGALQRIFERGEPIAETYAIAELSTSSAGVDVSLTRTTGPQKTSDEVHAALRALVAAET